MVNPSDFLSQRKDGSWQLNIYISPEDAQAVADALSAITKDYVMRTGISLPKSQAAVIAILGYAKAIEESRSEEK